MSDQRVILFVFGGRRGNMMLQVPLVKRILADNPNVEYHVWCLTTDASDLACLRQLAGDRIVVRPNPHDRGGPAAFRKVYQHYGRPEYEGAVFVKLDDDIVFLETARFGAFVSAIQAHPGSVVSAAVINNGACAALEPGLWEAFESLGVPLLDIHKHNRYAELAHAWFFEHWADRVGQSVELVPTVDWLSINAVGYDWPVACEFGRRLGEVPHPALIAGRKFPAPWGLMDEGMANLLPRIIMRGFTVAHLTFGPQNCTVEQCERWRAAYGDVGTRYLNAGLVPERVVLPGLSGVLNAQGPADTRVGWGTTGEVAARENDPCVGRFVS